MKTIVQVFFITSLALAATRASALDYVWLYQTQSYVQTDLGTLSENPFGSHSMNLDVVGSDVSLITTNQLTTPSAISYSNFNPVYQSTNGIYGGRDVLSFNTIFNSSSALTTDFASGVYTLSLNSQDVSLNLAPGSYPAIPLFSFSQGAWGQDGKFYFDPASTLNISTAVLSVDGATKTHGEMVAHDGSGFQISSVEIFNPESPLSLSISSGSFSAGQEYTVYLNYDNIVSDVISGGIYSDSSIFASYLTRTEVTLVAIPEPSTTAILLASSALVFVVFRRRKHTA